MAWSYVDPTLSNKDAVRFLIGDTDVTDQLVLDAEINYVLSQYSLLAQNLLAAPAAPSPTTVTTGGTVAAGVYQVELTYVNAEGDESAPSPAGSVTTTGSTSTIVIPAPPASLGAVGWYAYVTQAGGSTFTRQEAAGSPSRFGPSLTLTAPPTSSGVQPTAIGAALVAADLADLAAPAAEVCESIAAKFARLAQSRTMGPFTIQAANKQKQYAELAEALRRRMSMTLVIGGISEADKEVMEENTDVVQPAFSRGMMKQDIIDMPQEQQATNVDVGFDVEVV